MKLFYYYLLQCIYSLLCLMPLFVNAQGKTAFSNFDAGNVNPWVIRADKIDTGNYYGATVANGMIGIVSSPLPFKVKHVILGGVYDSDGNGGISNLLENMNPLAFALKIDGERIADKGVTNFKQALDMKEAKFSGEFQTDKAEIIYSYYTLRHLPYSLLLDVTVKAKKDITITGEAFIETPGTLNRVKSYFNKIPYHSGTIELITTTGYSPSGQQLCSGTSSFLFHEAGKQSQTVTNTKKPDSSYTLNFQKKIKSGETYRFSVLGSTMTNVHYPDPVNETQRLNILATLEGHTKLLARHTKAWEELWKTDIQIEGNPQAQQDIHNMMYHLYSFVRAGNDFAPPPMGLSGFAFGGHIFWDFDFYVFPALLMLQPEMARSTMDYRFNRLKAAQQNAYVNGYKGAMFPWESAASGVEETPLWALSGPFEHHISADIAIAAWHYYQVTQDKEWLREKGWPILKETAIFWADRVERNGKGKYEITNIVAADEWAENVDNNAFTNAAVKANLKYAAQAAKMLGEQAPADWLHVAANIPILQFPDGVTKEHASYTGQPIKQADVNLLAYPLKEITDTNQIKKDLAYYETRLPHNGTPAMTQSIFSLLYSRLGNKEKTSAWFAEAYAQNFRPPFRTIAETKDSKSTYFLTGAGGVLQAVMMGFGGLDITDQGIQKIKSTLPNGWKKLTLTGIGPKRENIVINP